MAVDWSDYERVHANRSNLRIHLFAVPLFDIAFLAGLIFLAMGDLAFTALSFLAAVGSMVLQKLGHGKEAIEPTLFGGPLDFLRRWFSEQYYKFPMFVISGRWLRQYRADGS